jgi:transposase
MTTDITIGCDLGDKQSELCILHGDGRVERPPAVKTTRAAMRTFFARAAAHVVIEVGTHSRWVSELLRGLGHQVTIANPRRVKLISHSDSKTDRRDAELLARLGRADLQLLAPVKHRGAAAQADLAVPKSRDVLVAMRTKLVNHVRATVKSFGERLPSCTAEALHRKARVHLPEALRAALEPVLIVLEALDGQIRAQDRAVDRIAAKHPDVKLLTQLNGVGTLTALVYLLTVEDKTRFKKSRTAGAFFGLRPKKDQSGAGDPQLRITKAGDPLVRRLLVQSANYILGPKGKDSDLRRWGLALAKRGGKSAKKRATIAVARKLAVLMHRLWVTGEVYEPVGYAETKRKAA